MTDGLESGVTYQTVELGGARYAIVPEDLLRELCAQAGVQVAAIGASSTGDEADELTQMNPLALAARLVARRKREGLSQAALAREAGIRVETLNRIERGKVTPDFATIRKLVMAIKAAECRREPTRVAAAAPEKGA